MTDHAAEAARLIAEALIRSVHPTNDNYAPPVWMKRWAREVSAAVITPAPQEAPSPEVKVCPGFRCGGGKDEAGNHREHLSGMEQQVNGSFGCDKTPQCRCARCGRTKSECEKTRSASAGSEKTLDEHRADMDTRLAPAVAAIEASERITGDDLSVRIGPQSPPQPEGMRTITLPPVRVDQHADPDGNKRDCVPWQDYCALVRFCTERIAPAAAAPERVDAARPLALPPLPQPPLPPDRAEAHEASWHHGAAQVVAFSAYDVMCLYGKAMEAHVRALHKAWAERVEHLERECERLKEERDDLRAMTDDVRVNAIKRAEAAESKADTLRARLAGIESQEPVARGLVKGGKLVRVTFKPPWLPGDEPLYAHPVAAPLAAEKEVAAVWTIERDGVHFARVSYGHVLPITWSTNSEWGKALLALLGSDTQASFELRRVPDPSQHAKEGQR